MSELNVRIDELEPMRVASVCVISESPETAAWARLRSWAEAKGYLGDVDRYPVFGFNNPGPSADRAEYGYEFWIRVPGDAVAEGEIEIKDFPGGLYAVTSHPGIPNPEIWMRLWDWVQSSSYEWREVHELEKPHDPLAAPGDMTFDLLLPVKKRSG
ncbi:MAG: GyrI-like domain-containing protein [Woeseiaceae bacterium]|nr:GyrI-like domain-containing protein [Woeseiaceae bacterium]